MEWWSERSIESDLAADHGMTDTPIRLTKVRMSGVAEGKCNFATGVGDHVTIEPKPTLSLKAPLSLVNAV
jgi:hypothetical protein